MVMMWNKHIKHPVLCLVHRCDLCPLPHLKKYPNISSLVLFLTSILQTITSPKVLYSTWSFYQFQKTFLLYIKSWNSSAKYWGTCMSWSQPFKSTIPQRSYKVFPCLLLCSHYFQSTRTLPIQIYISFKFCKRLTASGTSWTTEYPVTLFLTS